MAENVLRLNMATFQRTPPFGGAFARRFTRYSGLYFDEFAPDSAWIRETAVLRLPPMTGVQSVVLKGEFRVHPEARGPEAGFPRLEVFLDGSSVRSISSRAAGPWEARIALDPASAQRGSILYLRLHGVGFTNALAWLGRVSRLGPFQRYRAQNRNRQLRVLAIESDSGERIYDFSRRESPYSVAFARMHSRTGMNIVGFFSADLGIGESARCMARAADAATIPTTLVPLKLNCRNPLGDITYADRLQAENPYGVNVIHVDPPAARDIDHHHGAAFRKDKYNIGYFAWELPEFPDAWMHSFDYFDEIWCPSDFVRESIALKSPFPVLTMGHAIGFERPAGDKAALRARLGLPAEPFLFLSLFDLNSYSTRKNPGAVIEAFRRSGLAGNGASLVIKVHNADSNPADFGALNEALSDLPGTVVKSETLSRRDVYALEAACDCFVSLHRAEGFGLAVAECMYLGKPVLSTDWSATSEYLNRDNGFPVRCALVRLTENHGPYTKGSIWADPDVGHAAELMQRIVADPVESSRIGSAARRTIEERFSPAVIGGRYRRRLEAIACL
jgi:glycosyltransferase involved in cell wall biosynthesis